MIDERMDNSKNGGIIRCAIYTRKSNEDGLDQDFNSLDAQRDSCEAYIESQRSMGWRLMQGQYDDGGFSGGNVNRPGLQKLLSDVDAGKIDNIVVYKIDRLSRSLLDFSRMAETFEKKKVSFVSVTQQISTTNAHGRVMLNVLMSFAQFEREVASERIRDKFAAAKRRGKYCGGLPILGYDVDREQKKLLVNKTEVPMVQYIFRRFTQLGSVKQLAKELNEKGHRTKAWITKLGTKQGDQLWNIANVYRLIENRTYIGEVTHKENIYPGEHQAIIDRDVWDQVQSILHSNSRSKSATPRERMVSPLRGVMRCGHCDSSMGATYTLKKGRRYSYYICEKDVKRAVSTCPIKRIPSGDIEKAILEQMGSIFRTPTLIFQTYEKVKELENEDLQRVNAQKEGSEIKLAELRKQVLALMHPDNLQPDKGNLLAELNRQVQEETRKVLSINKQASARIKNQITEAEIASSFNAMDTFWEELFPAEQQRLIELLIQIVEVRETGLDIILKTGGISTLVMELAGITCEIKSRKESK